jgi:hypothetical protein
VSYRDTFQGMAEEMDHFGGRGRDDV